MVGIDGSNLVTGDIGVTGFGTLEPGNGSQEEAIAFTGITQNANGTATLTGVSSVLFKSPYTASSGLTKTHAGASTFILSNDAAFYGAILDYIDTALVSGGVPATNLVLGITKLSTAAVLASNPIAVGDNDIRVPTANPAGLFASSFASATPLPNVYSTGTTWLKPAHLNYIVVDVQAGGGGGGGTVAVGAGGGGGGGGGYGKKVISAATLASAVSVVVGGGGASSFNGGNSSFGSFVVASGGVVGTDGGGGGPTAGGAGGAASGGDISIPGGTGGPGIGSTTTGVFSLGGAGGNSQLGRGAPMSAVADGGSFTDGTNGKNYGGGGSGGCRDSGGSGAGGAGAQGVVTVTEYYA